MPHIQAAKLGGSNSTSELTVDHADPLPAKENMLTRRAILHKCLALGSLSVASSFKAEAMFTAFQVREKQPRKPTPPNSLGPFYKRLAPTTGTLRAPGDPGLPLSLSGQVLDTRGDVLPDATIEIWHTDHFGYYDIEGYRYRGKLPVGASGQYKVETIIPGHYPDSSQMCQHIHYLVTAPGHKTLVTQLYFATDPAFEGDPEKNFNRDPTIHTPELIRPVLLTGEPEAIHAAVRFELCLERL
jgi:protocatechuate 3,4-dioxygenase beta subunit